MPRLARSLQLLLVAGLAVGTATHVENIVRAGLSPRPELPLAGDDTEGGVARRRRGSRMRRLLRCATVQQWPNT